MRVNLKLVFVVILKTSTIMLTLADLAVPFDSFEDFGNGTCAIISRVRKTVPVTRKDCRWCRTRIEYSTIFVPQTSVFCCNEYRRNDAGQCVPTCVPECLYSECVRPGVCECYQGYEKIDSNTCQPICDPPCIHGWCEEPGRCECFANYKKNATNAHECAPVCSGGCGPYGYCTAPNECTCISGYAGKQCDQPICSLECANSFCSAPDRCTCNDGYVESENSDEWNLCVPFCANFVSNALCTSPGNWTCLEGFERAGDDCLPKCEQECVNGECVAPNVCTCSDGYEDASMNRDASNCRPFCSNGCNHGTCVEPEKCLCDDGHSEADGGCSPDCNPACTGGYCAAPDQCACAEGSLKAHHFVCIPTCSSYQNITIHSNDTANSTVCYHFAEYELTANTTDGDGSFSILEEGTTFYLPCSYRNFPEGSPGVHQFQCFVQPMNESLEVVCTNDVLPQLINGSEALNVSNNETATLDSAGGFNFTFILTYLEYDADCAAHFCSESNRTLALNQLSQVLICMDVLHVNENAPTFDQGPKSSAFLIISILVAIFGTAAGVGSYVYFSGRATIYRVNLLTSDALIAEDGESNEYGDDTPSKNIRLEAVYKNTEL
ncbi:Hypothetical protein NTJ_10245 [Nesidiocoris tenuis]|uniref:EGF-like domain-containing protein n=1 Tax=Nesidiocoris tenuis TaxID=355587 RepID=A0ABN7AZ47_9HEMI|nr:Hypothetical protein NTJ_10245 [Nesidiocoris tenuis]